LKAGKQQRDRDRDSDMGGVKETGQRKSNKLAAGTTTTTIITITRTRTTSAMRTATEVYLCPRPLFV